MGNVYDSPMMKKCDILRLDLEERCGTTKFDMLGQYRKWFDDRGIESEGEDGWPLALVFEEANIQAFVDDWLGR